MDFYVELHNVDYNFIFVEKTRTLLEGLPAYNKPGT